MEITLHYFTVLRKVTGKRQEKIRLNEDLTIGDMLTFLIKTYGEPFKEYVSPLKKKRLQLVLLVNNKDITQLNGLKTILHNGDTVSLILPIAGG